MTQVAPTVTSIHAKSAHEKMNEAIQLLQTASQDLATSRHNDDSKPKMYTLSVALSNAIQDEENAGYCRHADWHNLMARLQADLVLLRQMS